MCGLSKDDVRSASRQIRRLPTPWPHQGYPGVIAFIVLALMGPLVFAGPSEAEQDLGSPFYLDPLTDQEILDEQSWEGGFGLWQSDGLWEVGAPTAAPPSAAYEGDYCAGTNLAGNYPANSSGRLSRTNLVLPEIDAEAGERIRMRFVQFTETYNSHDYGYVQADSGAGWESISVKHYEDGEVWSPSEADLSAYAGKTISVCFYFHSHNSQSGSDEDRGWYVDSLVVVKGIVPPFTAPMEFEDGFGDWFADNGLWEVGTPSTGPGRAYRGPRCFGTDLHGNYPALSWSRLQTPWVQLPSVGGLGFIKLRFASWYSTYNSHDYCQVFVRTPASSWVAVSDAFSYSSNEWTLDGADLTAYADSTVRVAFYLRSVNSQSGSDEAPGWFIDHVYFEGANFVVADCEPYEDAAGVSGETPITVHFSNPLNTSTVNANTFKVVGSDSGEHTGTFQFFNMNMTVRFTPDVPFYCEETVTVTVLDEIMDVDGRAFDGDGDWTPGTDKEWSFEIGDLCPMAVLSVDPENGGEADSTTTLSVVFSEEVDPATLSDAAWVVEGEDSGVHASDSIQVVGDTATFYPTLPFHTEEEVTVTLVGGETGVAGLSGRQLAEDYVWSFTTLPEVLPAPVIDCPEEVETFTSCTLPDTFCIDLPIDYADTVEVDGATWEDDELCFTAEEAGDYVFTVVATNEWGSDTCEVEVEVALLGATVACFTPSSAHGAAPLTVTFENCSTPSGSGLTYDWTFGDGIGTSTEEDPSYTYDDPGDYTVSLVATGPCGADTTETVIVVTVPPEGSLVFFYPDTTYLQPASRDVPTTVELQITSEETWIGLECEIEFDNEKVNVRGLSLPEGHQGTDLSSFDNEAGSIVVTKGVPEGASGTNALLLIELIAVSEDPTSELVFTSVSLRDPGNQLIPVETDDGTILPATDLLGDYDLDGDVDFVDFTYFIWCWNEPDCDDCDLGGPIPEGAPMPPPPPWTTENYPYRPDGVCDFEDLMIFLQMYNWSGQFESTPRYGGGTALLSTGPSAAPFGSPNLEAPSEVTVGEVFTMSVDLGQAADLAACRFTVTYDRQTLAFRGTNLDEAMKLEGNHVVIIDRDTEQGMEIWRGVLGKRRLGARGLDGVEL